MERMISGIKPTGELTLGNYIGAIKEFLKYQNDYELFIFIADLHALTIYNEPKKLQENINNLVTTYLAAGLDPNKVCIFRQSDIPAHNQLEWVLTCNTQLSELTKMPQYKNYLQQPKNLATPAGMLLYPSLMNADILLYDTKYVPVGLDQKPHVDLTRDIAERFNKIYGDTFILPEVVVANYGAKVMSLADPTKKMSKSESDAGTIYLSDNEQTIKNKIKKAVTDSENAVYYNVETKPGISNLIVIYSALTNKSITEIENEFKNAQNYGIFKTAVAEAVCNELLELQNNINSLKQNNNVNKILEAGAARALEISSKKIDFVYKKIGLK